MKHIIGICIALTGGWLSAQTTKPGLWETSSKLQAAPGSEMAKQIEQGQKALASLPLEVRKQMEDMMAKQGANISMGESSISMKICVTPDMINRPPIEQRSGCTYTSPVRVGNTQKLSFKCDNGGSGEGEVTYSGDSYTSRMLITTARAGKNETVTVNGSGKYLGADCGSVKPMPAMNK